MLTVAAIGKRYTVWCLSFICLIALIWHINHISHIQLGNPWHESSPPVSLKTANATLGFGAIVTVSSENVTDPHAWRQKGLLAAANRTALDISIFPQREHTVKELLALQTAGNGIHPKTGPALAWLGHLQVLEKIVATRASSTVLILEDDADWDVSVKEVLAPASAVTEAIRNITNATAKPALEPYGLNWDVLWLGHCGFGFKDDSTRLSVQDNTVLDPSSMRAVLGQSHYRNNTPHTRWIAAPATPMCTFAYAVTLRGAEKLLERRHHGGQGMDFSTSVACNGALSCVATLPEVFHHHKKVGGGFAPQIVRENTEEEKKEEPRSFTQNIAWSARCSAEAGPDKRAQCLPNEDDFKKYNQ